MGVLIAAVVFLLAPLAQGQAVPDAPSVHFRGVSLAEALQRLVEVSDISLVYTSELVSGKTAYCATSDAAPEALLACVLRGSGLDYVRSSTGAYVLIASAEAPPPRGDLAGRVVDAATGEALPHAHVLLADASAGTTTNLGGQFTLGGLLSGPHLVTVRYVGYEPARREVVVPPQGQERLVVALRPRTHALAPLVVDGLARRPASDTLGAATLADGGLTALRPSGTADLADAAARLPGVASLQPLADLRIQGGAGGEYLTLLDGAPVRNPVSLGRHLAAFSPLALDRLTVHRAGFGTAWSHLVGVVAAEHDVSGLDGVNAAMSADAVSANVQAQGRLPLPGGREAAGMVALRTSAWGVYQDPALSSLLAGWDAPDPTLLPRWAGYPLSTDAFGLHRSAPDVSFSDLHAAARFPLSAFHTLRASGYRARNQLGGEFAAFVPATSTAPEHLLLVRNRYDWTNWAGQARLDGLLNARASYEVQATASHHASGYGYGGGVGEAEAPGSMEALEEAAAAVRPSVPLDGGTDWRHTIQELALTGALSYSLSPRTQVEGGLGVGYTDARIDRTGRFLAPLAHGADDWTLVAHATGQITVGAGTVVEPGVRLTYLPSFDRAYPEPRLALRHDGGSALGPYALRVATGLYRQYTNEYLLSSTGATSVVPYVLFWLPPDGSIAPPYAYHAALDAALWPTEAWTVEASAYAKAQPRLLALDHTPIVATGDAALRETREDQAQEDLLSAVRGHTLGGTVRVRWRHRGVSASTAYTHTHARRQVPGRFEGRLLPLPGTAPHALDLDAGLGLGRGVRVGASWRGSWGRRWALRRSYYDVLALAEGAGALPPFDLDAPEEHALPATMALDLDLTLTRPLGRSTLVLRALLANATDHRNVYDWSLETAASGAVAQPRLLPGRHLAFSVRVQL